MSVTINAHQLGRLLEQTVSHIGPEWQEDLNGIRLDVDARYLYAVASDRYTLAVARYGLTASEADQEPFARTIPARHLPSLREWIGTMQGAEWVTISALKDRLIFESPQSSLNIAVIVGMEYPDWRGVLRKATGRTVESEPFPALRSELITRFAETGQHLRVRITGDRAPILYVGQDFIGVQMPVGIAQGGAEQRTSFAADYSSWTWTFAGGSADADLAGLPAPERTHFGATTDVQETIEGLLRGVLRSTGNAFDTSSWDEDREAFYAHIQAGVADWMAYRYLNALYQVDPRAAQNVVQETADELDSGELGEFAWETATKVGHDPKKWQDDYEAAVLKRDAERAPMWALRLAAGLNIAQSAEIALTVADNPHVRFDKDEDSWVAVKPEPAAAGEVGTKEEAHS